MNQSSVWRIQIRPHIKIKPTFKSLLAFSIFFFRFLLLSSLYPVQGALISFFTFCIDLMDGLREYPGREALKLRAEASQSLSCLYSSFFSKRFCTFIFGQIIINYFTEVVHPPSHQVASMASLLKQKRDKLHKQIMKISELGVPV